MAEIPLIQANEQMQYGVEETDYIISRWIGAPHRTPAIEPNDVRPVESMFARLRGSSVPGLGDLPGSECDRWVGFGLCIHINRKPVK